LLKQHSWPGNVRELENVMRRALLLSESNGAGRGTTRPEIGPEHIHFDQPARLVLADSTVEPTALTATPETGTTRRLANIVQISEARAIMETLSACGGSRIAAARQLGISERTLRYRLAAFREAGLSVDSKGAYAGARG
jgi:two-component system response regulator FlrC